MPRAVVGDSVHADAVFPSGSSDVAVSFGSRADLAAANWASRAGSGDVAVAMELPVVGVGVSGARCDARVFQTMLNKTRAPSLLLRVCHALLMSTVLSKS
jgi:hypothetical protein